jgi:hypothetical protein
MATKLDIKATEESTYIVTAAFTDADDSAVTPTSVTWTLTDTRGNIINTREDVVVTPASTITIVLTGDDLGMDEIGDEAKRIITVNAVYTSVTYGAGLYLKGAAIFTVKNLVAVS